MEHRFHPSPSTGQPPPSSFIMKVVSPINTNVSIDSTLSSTNDDSLSAASALSLDHHRRRQQQQPQPHGRQQQPTKLTMDRDMTEDEVAVMVRNALRKARMAMHNSASSSASEDIEDDTAPFEQQQPGGMTADKRINNTGDNSFRATEPTYSGADSDADAGEEEERVGEDDYHNIPDEVSFGMSGEGEKFPLASCDSEGQFITSGDMIASPMSIASPTTEKDRKDALARRIEEEIRGARAFAERKYAAAGNGGGPPPMSSTSRGGGGGEQDFGFDSGDITPRTSPARTGGRRFSNGRSSAFSVDTQMTPTISNNADPSSPSRLPSSSSPSSTNHNIHSSWRDSTRKRMARTANNNNSTNNNRVASEKDSSTNSSDVGGAIPSPLPPTSPRSSKYSTVMGGGGENYSTSPREGGQVVVDNHLVLPATSSSASPRWGSSNNNNNKNNLSNDPTISEQEFAVPPTPNAHNLSISNATTSKLSSPPPPPPNTTNSNKPNNSSRQVLFRHPYPLPPPPPLPRNDEVIIASNTLPVNELNVKWVQPDTDLEALIVAAGNEDNLVRRSNACGALKVLASKESNKPKLCRTTGLLDGLVKACWDDAVDSDALDARTRAVTTLLALSEPKGNRQIMAKHPQLIELLIKVIKEDTGEARWRATSTLATLAKTPANRGEMGNFFELATVLGDLMLEGLEPPTTTKEESKQGGGGVNEVIDKGRPDTNEGNKGEEGGVHANATVSRDDYSSYLEGEHSTFDTLDDERLFTHTFSGTFTDGTGTTFTEDDYTYRSAYDSDTHYSDENEEDRSRGSHDSYDDEEEEYSVQDEEGVEMQISSLKKLNIENASEYLAKSQLSACATLSHLAKHCANAPILCKNEQLLNSLITVAGAIESPIHTRCLEILCNFTRFPSNNARLAAIPKCIDALLLCCKSKTAEDRMWSVRTIQNLCSDASSKVGLATGAVLTALSTAAMRKDHDEQYAAVGALMNLSTEPGSIVPLTNTKTVVATLVHLAHSPNTSSAVRKLACDSLATIGLWLQTLASAGTVPPEIPFSPLPTHSATGWLRWE